MNLIYFVPGAPEDQDAVLASNMCMHPQSHKWKQHGKVYHHKPSQEQETAEAEGGRGRSLWNVTRKLKPEDRSETSCMQGVGLLSKYKQFNKTRNASRALHEQVRQEVNRVSLLEIPSEKMSRMVV